MSIREPIPSPRRRGVVLALVLGLAALIALLSLGTWQVQRLAWKEGLVATIESRMAAEPAPLAEALAELKSFAELEYRPVRIVGTFEHSAERHFLATWKGASGFNVYTPLKLDDGDVVFINRGFVPYDRKDPQTRSEGQVEGRVEITGLLRPALVEKPSSIVPDNDPAKNIFYWKDIRAMASSSGMPSDTPFLGFFVDADGAGNPGGLPVGGVTIVDLPNNHLQYAVTWYGLAAALVVVLGAWLWRNRRSPAPRP